MSKKGKDEIMATNVLESVELRYQEGTSDKVYLVSLESSGNGYVVNYGYGRRDGTLNTGTKTKSPVDIAKADNIYRKLVKSKQSKGYWIYRNGGSRITVADSVKEDTGIYPQLSVAVTEDEYQVLLSSGRWCVQQKHDGRRMMVRKDPDNTVTCINRTGKITSCPEVVLAELVGIPGSYIIDGELVGDTYFVFDIIKYCGICLRGYRYMDRLKMLGNLLSGMPYGGPVSQVITVTGYDGKPKFVEEMRAANREGVVFKNLFAEWYPGRPSRGGASMKFKFWESCSCIVLGVNPDRRSVVVGLDGVSIGNVTIPPNHEVPDVGSVVEVRYLYVAGKGGSLYQPVYLGVRNDVMPTECTFERQALKYKAA